MTMCIDQLHASRISANLRQKKRGRDEEANGGETELLSNFMPSYIQTIRRRAEENFNTPSKTGSQPLTAGHPIRRKPRTSFRFWEITLHKSKIVLPLNQFS